ncbi:MAG: hypothetical protein H0Z40_10945 [Desulfotomaculum sp.]|nr:hypothetical protein [Desulfotomaculum sp.]
MNMEERILDSLSVIKDPATGDGIAFKQMNVKDDGTVSLVINSSAANTNYKNLEEEIAQKVLAFEGVKEVQVKFE